jgi:uncharacterized protein (TIGR02186 family)
MIDDSTQRHEDHGAEFRRASTFAKASVDLLRTLARRSFSVGGSRANNIRRALRASVLKMVAAGLAAALLSSVPSRAEDLVSGLSQDSIEITSNYTGSTIVVFGAIERPVSNAPRDIVVVVRGPETTMTVRRKDRIAGIWINRDRAEFSGVPAFYFVASTRPISEVAARDMRARLGLGLDVLKGSGVHAHHDPAPFRDALIRRQIQAHLYAELPGGVQYLSDTLFRVQVPVPANVARGDYTAQVFLFRNGYVISAQSTPFLISNSGLERQLFNFAHDSPLAYGIFAVAAAMLLGWVSSLVFRQSL